MILSEQPDDFGFKRGCILQQPIHPRFKKRSHFFCWLTVSLKVRSLLLVRR
ncbi:MAG TPA: hypothetical protein V6C85_16025 [Allocoleopsis sp.]